MRIYSKVVIDIATDEIVESVYEDYFGSVDLCKMSSDQGLATYQSKQMMNSFMGDMKQRFGEQSGIFKQLTDANTAIFNKGPDQEGWGAQQKAAINTLTSEGVAKNYQMAKAATNSALAGTGGGGNVVLPSSVGAGLTAQNANAAANQLSTMQNQNIVADYSQGLQNWQNAGGALAGVAGMENPTAYGNQALDANKNFFDQSTQIFNQEQQQKSQMFGAIGGLASSFLNPLSGALGGKLGGIIAGGGGSGSSGFSTNLGSQSSS